LSAAAFGDSSVAAGAEQSDPPPVDPVRSRGGMASDVDDERDRLMARTEPPLMLEFVRGK